MTVEERDARIIRMTDYQKFIVLQRIHDTLFRDDDILNPEKVWTSDTADEIAAAFETTEIGHIELGGGAAV